MKCDAASEVAKRKRDRAKFLAFLLAGVASRPAGLMDSAYFSRLRAKLPAQEKVGS